MRKLAAIVAFIKSLDYTSAKNVRAEFVMDSYQPYGHAVNNKPLAVCLHDRVYTAVLRIEQLPVKHTPDKFLSKLSIWLRENDKLRYRYHIERSPDGKLIPLDNPDINITDINDQTVTIELLIQFREPVFGVEDIAGELTLYGKKYRLADSSNPAEQFEPFYIINAYDSEQWRRKN